MTTVEMLDGRITSRGPTAPGQKVTLEDSEAKEFIRLGWAKPVPVEAPRIENLAGVQVPGASAGTAGGGGDGAKDEPKGKGK